MIDSPKGESTSHGDVNVDRNVAETGEEEKSPAGSSNEGDKKDHKIDDQHHQQRSENTDDDDDDEETCGFCKYMKGGGCRDAFVAWSNCVDREREAGSDFTEECKEATLALRECMLKHRDYYEPLLEEEEAAAAAMAEQSEATEEEEEEEEKDKQKASEENPS